MQPSNHTKLMNYVIGMCKKNKQWVTTFSDPGYDAEIIEQRITTSTGDSVKPDLVSVSNRLIHSLIFEVKGGTTINQDQLKRYSSLTSENVLRWVSVFDRAHHEFDVCVCDLAENHQYTRMINQNFPMLTFSPSEIVKERDFKRTRLNEALNKPISLIDKTPPLSYYPFSEADDDSYIALYVVRALLSIAMKNIKGGPSVFAESVISCDEVIAQQFHHVWKALSQEHKTKLKAVIREVLKRMMAKQDLKEILGLVEQKKGYKMQKTLDQFKKSAEDFIAELQSQVPLSDFV